VYIFPLWKTGAVQEIKGLVQLPFCIFRHNIHGTYNHSSHLSVPVWSGVPQWSRWWPGSPWEVSASFSPICSMCLGSRPRCGGSGLPKGWEVNGRPPWLLSCPQPLCLVSRTVLLTAAGPTWKEAIASKPLTPEGSRQCLKTSTQPHTLERPLGCWAARPTSASGALKRG